MTEEEAVVETPRQIIDKMPHAQGCQINVKWRQKDTECDCAKACLPVSLAAWEKLVAETAMEWGIKIGPLFHNWEQGHSDLEPQRPTIESVLAEAAKRAEK